MAIPQFACCIDNFRASKILHIIILVVESILLITAIVSTIFISMKHNLDKGKFCIWTYF